MHRALASAPRNRAAGQGHAARKVNSRRPGSAGAGAPRSRFAPTLIKPSVSSVAVLLPAAPPAPEPYCMVAVLTQFSHHEGGIHAVWAGARTATDSGVDRTMRPYPRGNPPWEGSTTRSR